MPEIKALSKKILEYIRANQNEFKGYFDDYLLKDIKKIIDQHLDKIQNYLTTLCGTTL